MRPLSGTLVLLVEDNAINQQVARETLESLGAAVDVAINGREAVEMYRAAPYLYDIIIMDLQMPEMNGFEAARAIRAMGQPNSLTIPIIAMTANAFKEDIEKCLEAGMNDHLAKPIDERLVIQKIKNAVAPRPL